jgi:hypothetical protein
MAGASPKRAQGKPSRMENSRSTGDHGVIFYPRKSNLRGMRPAAFSPGAQQTQNPVELVEVRVVHG